MLANRPAHSSVIREKIGPMPVKDKLFRSALRLLATVAILLGSLAGLGASPNAGPVVPSALPVSAGLRAFQLDRKSGV